LIRGRVLLQTRQDRSPELVFRSISAGSSRVPGAHGIVL
jgi:hypothetical protein